MKKLNYFPRVVFRIRKNNLSRLARLCSAHLRWLIGAVETTASAFSAVNKNSPRQPGEDGHKNKRNAYICTSAPGSSLAATSGSGQIT